jgi:hypothetical protein
VTRGRRAAPATLIAQFESVRGNADECWLWPGALTPRNYGVSPVRHAGTRLAHRISFALFVGPLIPGLHIDHQCHDPALCPGGDGCAHRRCVNPAHLAQVTAATNTARSHAGKATGAQHRAITHCPQNHPYDEANTYIAPNGKRHCRTCRRHWARLQNWKRRGRVPNGAAA